MGDFSNLMLNPAVNAGTGNIPLLIPTDAKAKADWANVDKALSGMAPVTAGAAIPPGTFNNVQTPPAVPVQAVSSAQPPAVVQQPAQPVAVAQPAQAVAQPAAPPAAAPAAPPAAPPAVPPAAPPAVPPAAPPVAGSLIGTLGSDVAGGGARRRRGMTSLLTGLGGTVESLGG